MNNKCSFRRYCSEWWTKIKMKKDIFESQIIQHFETRTLSCRWMSLLLLLLLLLHSVQPLNVNLLRTTDPLVGLRDCFFPYSQLEERWLSEEQECDVLFVFLRTISCSCYFSQFTWAEKSYVWIERRRKSHYWLINQACTVETGLLFSTRWSFTSRPGVHVEALVRIECLFWWFKAQDFLISTN